MYKFVVIVFLISGLFKAELKAMEETAQSPIGSVPDDVLRELIFNRLDLRDMRLKSVSQKWNRLLSQVFQKYEWIGQIYGDTVPWALYDELNGFAHSVFLKFLHGGNPFLNDVQVAPYEITDRNIQFELFEILSGLYSKRIEAEIRKNRFSEIFIMKVLFRHFYGFICKLHYHVVPRPETLGQNPVPKSWPKNLDGKSQKMYQFVSLSNHYWVYGRSISYFHDHPLFAQNGELNTSVSNVRKNFLNPKKLNVVFDVVFLELWLRYFSDIYETDLINHGRLHFEINEMYPDSLFSSESLQGLINRDYSNMLYGFIIKEFYQFIFDKLYSP